MTPQAHAAHVPSQYGEQQLGSNAALRCLQVRTGQAAFRKRATGGQQGKPLTCARTCEHGRCLQSVLGACCWHIAVCCEVGKFVRTHASASAERTEWRADRVLAPLNQHRTACANCAFRCTMPYDFLTFHKSVSLSCCFLAVCLAATCSRFSHLKAQRSAPLPLTARRCPPHVADGFPTGGSAAGSASTRPRARHGLALGQTLPLHNAATIAAA